MFSPCGALGSLRHPLVAHWDHIGGFTYLKTLIPEVTFYGRDNYKGTVERVLRHHTYEQFRGAGFQNEWVNAYKPDVAVSDQTEIMVGGSSFP